MANILYENNGLFSFLNRLYDCLPYMWFMMATEQSASIRNFGGDCILNAILNTLLAKAGLVRFSCLRGNI